MTETTSETASAVLIEFVEAYKETKRFDWDFLAVSADCRYDDPDKWEARFFRWLSIARVFPLRKSRQRMPEMYCWFTYHCWDWMDAQIWERIPEDRKPLHACIPRCMYDLIRSASPEHRHPKTMFEAFYWLHKAYEAQRFMGRAPIKPLKCPYCGLVQDKMPPKSEYILIGHTECAHCERHFEVNDE